MVSWMESEARAVEMGDGAHLTEIRTDAMAEEIQNILQQCEIIHL
jgi:hypothetical protein